MPRWLSSAKVEVVRKLLAEDPAMLLRESLGISADGSEKAFAQRDIENMLARTAPELEYSARDPRKNTQHIFLAVDPSGGGASAFSIASIACGPTGFLYVRKRTNSNLFYSNPIPIGSPGHSSHSVHTIATSASGFWAMPATKLGMAIGSTRSCKSETSSGSEPAKLSRTPGSL